MHGCRSYRNRNSIKVWGDFVMAFNIIIQRNNSEKNAIEKDLTILLDVAGTLRDECSIINPVITIQGNLTQFVEANYLTIPDFGRSYFITDITSIRNGVVQIRAHVDVLFSFRGEIVQQTAIVNRQENEWNLYLNDGSLHFYQNPIVLTRAFPSGFTTQNFVFAVAGS